MAKPTQAHMTQSWSKNSSDNYKDLRKRQMEYYMGAKLIEVGIDPKSTIMRWSVETKGDRETWTCSTYWGESKENLLKEEGNK